MQNKDITNTEITPMKDLSSTFTRKIETVNRTSDIIVPQVTKEYLDYAGIYDVIDVGDPNFNFKTVRGNDLDIKKEAFEIKSRGVNYLECIEKGQKIDVSEFIDGATTNLKIGITYENISSNKAVIFFRNSGNRLNNDIQIFHNSIFDGKIFNAKVGYTSVFIRGASGGRGAEGQLAPIIIDSKVNNILLEIDLEGKTGALFYNGGLIDTVDLASNELPEASSYLDDTGRSLAPDYSTGIIRFSTMINSTDIVPMQDLHNIYRYNLNTNKSYIDDPKSYLVSEFNATTGNVKDIFYKNLNHIGIPASLTKIATTVCLLDTLKNLDLNLEFELTKTNDDASAGSGNNLSNGDTITCRDALYNLMLPSSNVTANIIARTFGRIILEKEGVQAVSNTDAVKKWVELINERASSLGMDRTQFASPSGLGSSATCTAKDIAKLMQDALNYPELMTAWAAPEHTMTLRNNSGDIKKVHIETTVSAVKDGLSIGGKTGTLIPVYGYNVGFFYYSKKQEKLYSIVILGCSSDSNRTFASNELIRMIEEG